MRLGVFVSNNSGLPRGHLSYQDALLEGLLRQTEHEVVVLASERVVIGAVPSPHELVRVAHPRQRLVGLANYELHSEFHAARAARSAHVDALIANGQWHMPRPRHVARIVTMYEAGFLDAVQWGVYSTYEKRQRLTVPQRNLRNAHAVVCLSEHGRGQIAEQFGVPAERIYVGPPALLPFPPQETSRWLPSRPFVLSVGWFHPRKDLPLTLRSWARAVELGADADLVLAGTEGPIDRRNGVVGRRVLDIVGSKLASRVHFTGAIPRADLGVLYRNASTLLMTSMHEGFGIPAIEAFSFGRRVIAVNRSSLAEVVGAHGTLVAPDPDDIAAALCAPDEGHAATRTRYAATFTVSRQVSPYLALAEGIGGG